MSDEDIEKLIERKVEEKIDKKRKEVREEVKEELGVSESGEDKQEEEETGLSRRSFLKMLGVGAGSLALSSSAAGIEWSVLQPSSQGTSGVEAKKATMGSAPFQLLGDLEAKDGELIWDESNSYIPASSINQSGISHDNISNVSADDHHPEVSAGTNISVDSSNTVSVSPQGKGSSLDADTVDGKHASEIGNVSKAVGSGEGTLKIRNGYLYVDPNKYTPFTIHNSSFSSTTSSARAATSTSVTGYVYTLVGKVHPATGGSFTSTGFTLKGSLNGNKYVGKSGTIVDNYSSTQTWKIYWDRYVKGKNVSVEAHQQGGAGQTFRGTIEATIKGKTKTAVSARTTLS